MRFRTDTLAHLSAGLSLACVPLAASAAGGSYLVDDASIAADGHCQVESWLRALDHGQVEANTAPACTVLGVEWSATGTRSAGAGRTATSGGIGAKWIAGDLDRDGRAVGFAGGALWSNGSWVSESVYVPASIALGAEGRCTLHVNAGARRTPATGWRASGGVALDAMLAPDWHAIAEFSAIAAAEKTAQAGLRWSAVASADVDVVIGHSRDAVDENWLTIGLNLSF